MIGLSNNAKGWLRKVVCTALPPALTEDIKTELVLELEYGILQLDAQYTRRTYRSFGMEHYQVAIKIDDSVSNIRKINNSGKDVDDFLDIVPYKFEGTYRGNLQYHLSRYASQVECQLDR